MALLAAFVMIGGKKEHNRKILKFGQERNLLRVAAKEGKLMSVGTCARTHLRAYQQSRQIAPDRAAHGAVKVERKLQ